LWSNEVNATADLAAAFAAGLFGSLHCIGMCGPLAALGCRSPLIGRSFVSSLLFVVGKLGSYTVLGLLAGLIGATIVHSVSFSKIIGIVSVAGGSLMLVILVVSRLKSASTGAIRITVILSKFAMRSGNAAPLLLGMAAAFLPCGLLYAMVARSAAAAQPVLSMGLMQAFGLGTSPTLLGVGILLRALPQKWSRWGSVAGEIVIVLTAIVLIWRGIAGLSATAAGPSCCQ
jgi:uncharacterized protein